MIAFRLELVMQFLDTRLVGDRRIRKGLSPEGLSGILSGKAMDIVQFFRPVIVGFEFGIFHRPFRSSAVDMGDSFEIFFPKPKKGCSIDLRISSDPITGLGMEVLAVI
jgi:hypothetical protein